ncbi:hypothetical protein J6590_021321 [Homalodisca vitripennis]|nr:hypothetical protein J6590_021321 [Homalodisca vitripennis]
MSKTLIHKKHELKKLFDGLSLMTPNDTQLVHERNITQTEELSLPSSQKHKQITPELAMVERGYHCGYLYNS